jgi:hypothetical protein
MAIRLCDPAVERALIDQYGDNLGTCDAQVIVAKPEHVHGILGRCWPRSAHNRPCSFHDRSVAEDDAQAARGSDEIAVRPDALDVAGGLFKRDRDDILCA